MLSLRKLTGSLLVAFAAPLSSFAGISISITIAPPALPVYVQPECPGQDYIWTPGYWAYGPQGYYWVPGTWVMAPQPGFLWTPGYWGLAGGIYGWHAGYWGPHVGFYGGVNYGFGYIGRGYEGGMWRGGHFAYNTTVNHINVTNIHNTYNKTVIVNNTTVNRVSFNGPGGVMARPSPAEQAFEHERHIEATNTQIAHEHAASFDRGQMASVNHGRPANFAVAHPMAALPNGQRPGSLRPNQPPPIPHAVAAANHPQGGPHPPPPPRPERREEHPGEHEPHGEHR